MAYYRPARPGRSALQLLATYAVIGLVVGLVVGRFIAASPFGVLGDIVVGAIGGMVFAGVGA